MDLVRAKYDKICSELNLDSETKDKAWDIYEDIAHAYVLEGDPVHWLCCSLFVTCLSTHIKTIGKNDVQTGGNYVSIISLLRSCNINFHEFFKKMDDWMRMDKSVTDNMSERIHLSHKSLAISYLLYEKLHTIFKQIFIIEAIDTNPQFDKTKSKKKCILNAGRLFEFTWHLICLTKKDLGFSTELVHSFHLMICCIDLVYQNVLIEKRFDLLKTDFPGCPLEIKKGEFDKFVMKDDISIVSAICDIYQCDKLGIYQMKTYYFHPTISEYSEANVLFCDLDTTTCINILSTTNFDTNFKNLTKEYSSYVLSTAQIDETIFLAHNTLFPNQRATQSAIKENIRPLVPDTPVTCHSRIRGESSIDPITVAINSLVLLKNSLETCMKRPIPSTDLQTLLNNVGKANIMNIINKVLKTMEKTFRETFERHLTPRYTLANELFFCMLQSIIEHERSKSNFSPKLLQDELFYTTLFVCSLEIVNYAHDADTNFPDILRKFKLPAYSFYKIIEIYVQRNEQNKMLTRDVIKYLSRIEEMCLDHLVWEDKSPLWDIIKSEGVPVWQQVDAPNSANTPRKNAILNHAPAAVDTVRRQLFNTQSNASEPGSSSAVKVQLVPNANRTTGTINIIPGKPTVAIKLDPINNPAASPSRNSSSIIFFRKFYKLAFTRMCWLFTELSANHHFNQVDIQKIWTLFEDKIVNNTNLLCGRHLDQIILSVLYLFIRLTKNDKVRFLKLIEVYSKLPLAKDTIYRSVLIKDNQYDTVIEFYNQIIVPASVEYTAIFKDETKTNLLMSPHPPNNSTQLAVQVTDNVTVRDYVPSKIIKTEEDLRYIYDMSPHKELANINKRIKEGFSPKHKLPYYSSEEPPAKRVNSNNVQRNDSVVQQKLKSILNDRVELSQTRK